MAFSIKQLLFSMAVVAFAIVAINVGKPVLGKLFDVLTLGILIAVAYGAWLSRGEVRAFRIGFLCWAVLYFLLVKKTFDFGVRELMNVAYRQFLQPEIIGADGQTGGWGGGGSFFGSHPNFYPVCHSALLLLLGLVGGWVTVYFYRKQQQKTATDQRAT